MSSSNTKTLPFGQFKSRIDSLEKTLVGLTEEIQKAFQANSKNTKDGFNEQAEIITAIIEELGLTQKITDRIDAARKDKAQKESDAQKSLVNLWKSQEFLVSADTIGPTSFVGVQALEADGSVAPPGYELMQVPNVKAEFRDKVVGLKVGDELELGPGAKIRVLEIYNPDMDKIAQAKAKVDAANAATPIDPTPTIPSTTTQGA